MMKAMTCLSDAWYVYWTSLCRTWKVQGFVYIRIGFDNHLDGLPGARLRLQVASLQYTQRTSTAVLRLWS